MAPVMKAKKNQRVLEIFNDLSLKIPIKFSKSSEDSWGIEIKNGTAHISFTNCKNPDASLAHELLHIETQLNGYKRIKIGFCAHEKTSLFSRLITCLDNELQHYKFYDKFISQGFQPDVFYNDSDESIESYLKGVTRRKINKLIEILPDFFSLIAPGGSIPINTQDHLIMEFCGINNGVYEEQFRKIEAICSAWRKSESYDNIPIVKEIMLTLYPKPHYTWFGFDPKDNRPENGFFVDQHFEM